MKKYVPYANLMTLGTGALGMLLQFLLRAGGTDEKGLYPAAHPAWVLLCILTPIVLVGLWLLVCGAGNSRNYRSNFPASIPAAAGYLAAGIGLLVAGIGALSGERNIHTVSGVLGILGGGKTIYTVSGVLGILGGVLLFWAAWCRFQGKKCVLLPHILPCVFFALQLFILGQTLGAEPELCRYLFRFLAMLSMIPACYWLWSFDVGMGHRPKCLFWCLAAAYLNLVAVAASEQWLLHLCMAAWLLTALPRLRYLPKRQRPVPAAQPAEPPVEPAAPQEVDAMLDQLLSDLDAKP